MQANTTTIIQSGVTASDVGPRLSGNGRYAAFTTTQGLLATDTIALSADIYVKDLQTGTLTLASTAADGAVLAAIDSEASVSNDGQLVAFQSNNGTHTGVMVKNLSNGALGSASTNAAGVESNGDSYNAVLAGNVGMIAFLSKATNLAGSDSNGFDDVHVKNLQTGAVVNASTTAAGVQANAPSSELSISADGRYVTFTSYADNLVANDNSNADIFLKDLATGNLSRISSDSNGVAANGNSDHASFSADGRYVVFSSSASNLVPGDGNGMRDVFRKDLVTGQTVQVSVSADGVQGGGDSGNASISADGRYIAFSSSSNLTAGDGDGKVDIFIKDVLTGALTRVSHNGGAAQFNHLESNALAGNGLELLYTSITGGIRDLVHAKAGAGFGSTAGETLSGTAGADVINANQGADTITGLGGNDVIDGGGGLDTAVYQGARANYTINATAAGTVIANTSGGDGSDTVANVERLHFANADVALDVNGTAGVAYRLYQAAYDRVPDAAGLGYWIKQMDNGLGRFDVAGHFMAGAEAQAVYGVNPSNNTALNLFYNHVLHRNADSAGFAYWLNVLDTNVATQAQVLASFAESAENQAALIGTMQNGMAYVPWAG